MLAGTPLLPPTLPQPTHRCAPNTPEGVGVLAVGDQSILERAAEGLGISAAKGPACPNPVVGVVVVEVL